MKIFIEIVLIIQCGVGLLALGWESTARKEGWPVGEWFTRGGLMIWLGFASVCWALIWGFILAPLWFLLALVIGGFIVSGVLFAIFKSRSPIVCVVGVIACFLITLVMIIIQKIHL